MHLKIKDSITVNAPASEVWRVLAHEFDKVDRWGSGIDRSYALTDIPVVEGAPVAGRACIAFNVFGDAYEAFTYYDEEGMRFGYQAIGELPRFFEGGENNWQVTALQPDKSLVQFHAEVDVQFVAALVMLPFFPIIKRVLGTRTLKELKYYVEHGQPHPRKAKAIAKQRIKDGV